MGSNQKSDVIFVFSVTKNIQCDTSHASDFLLKVSPKIGGGGTPPPSKYPISKIKYYEKTSKGTTMRIFPKFQMVASTYSEILKFKLSI